MNRINFFRKGDRVRVTTWRSVVLGNDGYGQYNYLFGRIGTVYAATAREVDIEFDDGQCYTLDVRCVMLVSTKKRSFRQIVSALAKKAAIKEDLRLVPARHTKSTYKAYFVCDSDPDEENCTMLDIWIDGTAYIRFLATAAQLAAISAAISEIAANYKAEQEEQK